MSFTIRPTPDGKQLVKCDACRSQATTPFPDVARIWKLRHKCGTPDTVQPDGSVFEPVPDGVA